MTYGIAQLVARNRQDLERALSTITSELLKEKGYLCFVDIFMKLGYLSKSDYEHWRFKRVSPLERVLHVNLSRIHLVAYLLAADKYSGPLASWLIDTNQPVIRTRNAFSILRLTQLVCIRAHFSHFTPRSSSLTVTQTVCGWGHGGTRYNSTSLRLHT
jgi:hypothetical protein